ncbi:MAG: 30S ribosomal protein S16, partial [Phycisphaerales bacterium]|nr:30S ribosomal protein S16 [Phycisphaerales bacterium]
MVRIRMMRLGRRRRAFFRINAVEIRTKRNGKVLEQLGWYDPITKDPTKQLFLEEEKIKVWLKNGAQPSDTVMDILAKRNLVNADEWKAVRAKRVERKIAAHKAAATAAAAAAEAAPAPEAKA